MSRSKGANKQLLSKSRFLAGGQCQLRLWYQCYDRELASPVTAVQQARFDEGHYVGKLATQRHPGGILITEDHFHHKAAVESTLTAMADENVPAIFEAAFIEDDVRIRVDILERASGGRWNLIEVKSSNKVKSEHYDDVAVQYHVLRSAGLDIEKAGLLHLNKDYLYDGNELDLNNLFSFDDMIQQAIARQDEVKRLLKLYKHMLSATVAPKILPARHCKTPFTCEFRDHCTSVMPENWVMHLYRITKNKLEQLYKAEILDISDVPADFPMSEIQERVRDCVIKQQEYIDPQLRIVLNDVEYPLHFLDFEVFTPAIPRYAGTSPYQRLPFQWSDHVISSDGEYTHSEHLNESDTDPRERFVESLLDTLGGRGTIFVYSSYEKSIIKSLADHYGQLSDELHAIIDRFNDLEVIIRNNYYHPQFYGSFSIKKVLPALVPDMSYKNLEIQEGEQASLEYLKMIDSKTSVDDKKRIKNDLLAYCKQDTLAMVRIREELLKKS